MQYDMPTRTSSKIFKITYEANKPLATITIENPSDQSTVVLPDIQIKRVITKTDSETLKHYSYDQRVQAWFSHETAARADTTLRHAFAQRVDEILQLFGQKALFINDVNDKRPNRTLRGIHYRS